MAGDSFLPVGRGATGALILRMALGYALFAAAWIVLSDELLELFVDAERMTRLAKAKGLAFVFVTSALLFLALRSVAAVSARTGVTADDAADAHAGAPLAAAPAYALAVLITIAMLTVRLAIDLPFVERPMIILFMLPVTLSALFGGLGPGLVATAVAVLGQGFFALSVDAPPPSGVRELFVFQLAALSGNGLAVSLASHALHRGHGKLRRALTGERAVRAEYRLLSDQLPDPVWRKDRAGRYVDCNLRFATVVGLPRADIVGRTEADIFPSAAAHFAAAEARVLATLAAVELEEHWPAPATIGWVHAQLVPVFDADGACTGTLGIARDIDRRHLAERALQEREALFRTLFDIGDDAVLVAALAADGAPGAFTLCNTRALQMFGCTRETLSGLTPGALFGAAGAPAFAAALASACSDRRARCTISARRCDGQDFPAELVLIRFALGGGGGEAMMFGLRDVTARVAAETEQARLHEQVTQMQKLEAIGQLTGGIAHDFNNILATIAGYTELAQRRAPDTPAPLADYLAQIAAAARRGRELVLKLMAFSRSRQTVETAAGVVPHAAVAEAVALLRSTIPASIVIDARLATDTGAVRCEAIEIEQLVMNLAINARDAIDGPGRIAIELACVSLPASTCAACLAPFAGPHVELAVADSGPGIAERDLSRLFQPFFTTKEVGRGTGLGLAVVHGIVHRAGGHVLVERAAGGGARFRLCLPPTAAAQGAVAATGPVPLVAEAGAGQHLFVVDDEPALGRFLRELLELEGYRVTQFDDARLALAAFDTAPEAVDAVLTDLAMPGLPGDAFARELLLRRPALPVLLMSGNGEFSADRTIAALGVRARLAKPIDSGQLLASLARALGSAPVER